MPVFFFLYLFISIICAQIPVLQIINAVLVYKYIDKFGKKQGFFYCFVQLIIIYFLTTTEEQVLISLITIALIVSAYYIKINNENSKIFNATLLKSAILAVVFLFVLNYKVIFNLNDVYKQKTLVFFEKQKKEVIEKLSNDNINQQIELEQLFEKNINIFFNVLPGIIIGYIFLSIYIAYLIFSYGKIQQQPTVDAAPNILFHYFSDHLVWLFILGFAADLFINDNLLIKKILLNILFFMNCIYYIQGSIVSAFYLKKINFYLPLFFVITIPFFFLVIVIGISDIWIDFRKIRKQKIIQKKDINA